MITWYKTLVTVNRDGEKTIQYTAGDDSRLTIESRLRQIPHANGSGTWDHTTYWVLWNGIDIKERNTLRDAKAYAEELAATKI